MTLAEKQFHKDYSHFVYFQNMAGAAKGAKLAVANGNARLARICASNAASYARHYRKIFG